MKLHRANKRVYCLWAHFVIVCIATSFHCHCAKVSHIIVIEKTSNPGDISQEENGEGEVDIKYLQINHTRHHDHDHGQGYGQHGDPDVDRHRYDVHLHYLDHESVHGNGSLHDIKPSPGKVWAYGLVCCTGVITLARLGVVILPHLRKDLYEKLIIAMVGLAAGTLTGSSIFHLLPKAFSLEEIFEDEEYIGRCLVISAGIWAFLMIERLLTLLLHHKERRLQYGRRWRLSNVLALPRRQEQNRVSVISLSDDEYHGDYYAAGINGGGIVYGVNEKKIDRFDRNDSLATSRPSTATICPTCLAREVENSQMPSDDKYRLKTNELPDSPIQFQEGSLSLVSTEAWMVIAGDCFLDFVDGLSIGTAFHDSILTGLSISLGILLEELPHELGEFAVLLNAGLPFRRALLFKFLASTTTYLGLGVGIWLGNIEASPYVFALAAGMFLYIALVDMVPELNKVALKSSQTSVVKGLRVLFLQNVGLLIGIAVIYFMAKNEQIFNNF